MRPSKKLKTLKNQNKENWNYQLKDTCKIDEDKSKLVGNGRQIDVPEPNIKYEVEIFLILQFFMKKKFRKHVFPRTFCVGKRILIPATKLLSAQTKNFHAESNTSHVTILRFSFSSHFSWK